MAFEIAWSAEAQSTYLSIIEYLTVEWSENEVIAFVKRVDSKLEVLMLHPEIGAVHRRKYKIRRTVIHKHVSLVYHVDMRAREKTLLTFWDTRQHPTKLRH